MRADINLLLAGLLFPVRGAALGLVGKGLEVRIWNRVEAILQDLNPQYPQIGPLADTQPPGADQFLSSLEHLFNLKKIGAISEEECDAKKKGILSHLQ